MVGVSALKMAPSTKETQMLTHPKYKYLLIKEERKHFFKSNINGLQRNIKNLKKEWQSS